MQAALVGTFLLRGIGFVFSAGLGKEALGLGDADLMMMAGSFLGWQIVAVAFFLSVFPALVIGVTLLIVRRDNSPAVRPITGVERDGDVAGLASDRRTCAPGHLFGIHAFLARGHLRHRLAGDELSVAAVTQRSMI